MGSAFQLFIFALILYGIGNWGLKIERWSIRIFTFAFAMPAGFFMGWSVIQVIFPHFSMLEQLLIAGSASVLMGGRAAIVWHYTKVK